MCWHPEAGVGHVLALADVPSILEPLEAGLLLAEYAGIPQPPFIGMCGKSIICGKWVRSLVIRIGSVMERSRWRIRSAWKRFSG